jgi:hypothetical protein
MKKTLVTIGATTALAFAGLGVASVASAQVDGTDGADSTENGTTITEDGERTERGERGERRGRNGRGCGPSEAVAEILGMEQDELRAELEGGATLAEIAEANGVDPDDLVDQLVADATERIDEKVAEGRIDEAEAAEKLADKTERIEDKVYGTDTADTAETSSTDA